MTQAQMVLRILIEDGSITTYEAFDHIGCTRLSARIHDIRNGVGIKQYDVDEIKCTKKNRFGGQSTFSVYYLKNKIQCRVCNKFDADLNEINCCCHSCGREFETDLLIGEHLYRAKESAQRKASRLRRS